MASRNAKQLVYHALIKLLKTNSLNEIKVSQLIQEAGISRNAYYYNFYSIDGILNDMINTFFEEYTNLVFSWESMGATDYLTGRSERLVNFEIAKWKKIYENRDLIFVYYKEGFGRDFMLRFVDIYYKYFKDTDFYVTESNNDKYLLSQSSVYDYIVTSGSYRYYGILEKWISKNFAETPTEVAHIWLTAMSIASVEYSVVRKS